MRNPEIWIILIVVGFLVFGAKRMPDAARGLGRSLRIFKAETKGLLSDDDPAAPGTTPAPAAPREIPATPAAPPVPAMPVYQQPVEQVPAPVAAPVPAPVAAHAPVTTPVDTRPAGERDEAS